VKRGIGRPYEGACSETCADSITSSRANPDGLARAFECVRRRAMVLSEAAARFKEELATIRQAMAIREALCRREQPGLHVVRHWR